MSEKEEKRKYFQGAIDDRSFKELLGYYDFYATPDGEECLPKTFYYTKYATIAGGLFSVYEMIWKSQPKTVYGTIARFGRFTLPFAGMGLVFGSSLCIVAQARKKDDIYNHLIAGALAGSVWGFKYNRVFPGHLGAILVGFYAAYHKYYRVNDLPILKIRSPNKSTFDPRLDWHVKMYDDPGRPDQAY